MNFFGMATRVCAFFGAFVLIVGIGSAKGAPQEAAIAGIAIALAVLPYVLFRVMQITEEAAENRVRYLAILKRLDAIADAQGVTEDARTKPAAQRPQGV